MMIEIPAALIFLHCTNASSANIGDNPAEGSSSSSTDGSIISARPIATICRSPPDSAPALVRRRSASNGNNEHTTSNRVAKVRGRRYTPICMFSSMVSEGNTLLFCGT